MPKTLHTNVALVDSDKQMKTQTFLKIWRGLVQRLKSTQCSIPYAK